MATPSSYQGHSGSFGNQRAGVIASPPLAWGDFAFPDSSLRQRWYAAGARPLLTQLLDDGCLGFLSESWIGSVRRRPRSLRLPRAQANLVSAFRGSRSNRG